MTIVTHVLATTLGVQALRLRGGDAALAYVFGVGVDVDHAIKAPFYLRTVGLANKRGYYWRTSLQEPVALAAYSPPGAFIGGFDSTTSGGLGSVTNSQAVLLGGTTLVTGPWGHGSDTGAPTSCWVTALRTVWLVGS